MSANLVRLLDFGITVTLIVAMLTVAWTHHRCRRDSILVNLGICIVIPTLVALMFNVMVRILDDVDDSLRSGYAFAVISRGGMAVLFLGLALRPAANGKSQDAKERQIESETAHEKSSSLANSANNVPSGVRSATIHTLAQSNCGGGRE